MKWLTTLTFLFALALGLSAQPNDAVREELKKFEGTWERIICKNDGVTEDPELSRSCTWMQDDKGNFKLLIDGKINEEGVLNEIDPTKSPKTVNAVTTVGAAKGTKLIGIYKFVGDTVEICWATDPAARPTKFSSPVGSKHLYEMWRRVKK